MLFDGHFNIETHELAHMSMSERIFSSEDRTNFEHSLEISHNTHLLIKLRWLSEASFTIEIVESKDICTSFWTASDEFGCVNFNEIIIDDKLSEKMADSWR